MKILWISISMTRQFWFVWMNIFQFRADNLVLAIFEFNDQTNYLTIKYVNKCKQFSVSILMMRLLCRSHLFGTSDTDYRCDWQCFKCNHSCGMYCALTVCAHFLTSLLSLQCFSMFFFAAVLSIASVHCMTRVNRRFSAYFPWNIDWLNWLWV